MPVWRILFLNTHPLYANGLAAGLIQVGHDVRVFNPGCVPAAQQEQAVGGQIDSFRPDVVLSIGHVNHYMKAAAVFSAIKKRGVYHVYWATEDKSFHHQISVPCARYAHAVFTIDSSCMPHYRSLGLPCAVLPFACNPAIHHGYPPDPSLAHDLVLLCNNTQGQGTFRPQSLLNLLQPFLGGGYDLAVWGFDWEKPFAPGVTLPSRFHYGRLAYEDAVRAVCSARIVMGPQWETDSPDQVSCRAFETLGAGGFFLTSDTPGVRHYFNNGVHLVTTDSPARTKALVDHYLSAPVERQAIAACGQDLVHRQHTYFIRACEFYSAIERWRWGC